MQDTEVLALVREDPTCYRAAGPVRYNCWACALEPTSHSSWTRGPRLLRPARLEPVLRNGRGRRSERPAHGSKEWLPPAAAGEGLCAANAAKNKLIN